MDIGTEATPGSLAALDSYMSKHPTAGGCCGEIIVKDWRPPGSDLVDMAALMAQWFEYKMGHVLNKTLEDIMGYIGVLPGAFSCYRWDALTVNNYHVLSQYFRPFIAPHTLPWKLSNIYHLAEDRIMSEEIIKLKHKQKRYELVKGEVQQVGETMRKTGYTLGFVKAAKALTEGAPNVVFLIKQRRRWINGGWFALVKMVLGGTTLSEIRESGHSCSRKFWLLLELMYLFLVISFTWMAVGAFYLGFMMALSKVFEEKVPVLYQILRYVYIFHLVMVFVISLSLKPDSCPRLWKYFVCFFAVVAWFLFGTVLYSLILGNFSSQWVRYVVLSVLIIMLVAAFCYGEEYFKLAVASPAYVALLPSYINILGVFAACKTDDISWGTRGAEESSTQKSFSRLKTWYLLFYIICNVAFGLIFENINKSSNEGSTNDWSTSATTALIILYSIAMGVLLFPFISLLLYLTLRTLRRCRRTTSEVQLVRQVTLRNIRELHLKDKEGNADMKRMLKDLLPSWQPDDTMLDQEPEIVYRYKE